MSNRRPSRKMGGGALRPASSPPDGLLQAQPGKPRRARARPNPAWGDQSLEARIPSFLETLHCEAEARFSALQRRAT
jgi:hypothetical protein